MPNLTSLSKSFVNACDFGPSEQPINKQSSRALDSQRLILSGFATASAIAAPSPLYGSGFNRRRNPNKTLSLRCYIMMGIRTTYEMQVAA